MEKAYTFIDKNRIWFSFGTVVIILTGVVWLNTNITVLNTNLENFIGKYDERATYVDYRMADFEIRIRELERK